MKLRILMYVVFLGFNLIWFYIIYILLGYYDKCARDDNKTKNKNKHNIIIIIIRIQQLRIQQQP